MLSRKYDSLFAKYGGIVPVEYLRSLAWWESNMKPGASAAGSGWGLLQVVEVVRHDFNKANKTKFTRQNLLDPAVNVRIACWLLNIIARVWDTIPGLKTRWSDDDWVKLFTAGWNSGWSKPGGLPKIMRYMWKINALKRGQTPQLNDIKKYAKASGSVFYKYAQWNRTYYWAPLVLRDYRNEQLGDESPTPAVDSRNDITERLGTLRQTFIDSAAEISAILSNLERE